MTKPEGLPRPEPQTVTATFNGPWEPIPKNEDLTFAQIVDLAFDNFIASNCMPFTIKLTRGQPAIAGMSRALLKE